MLASETALVANKPCSEVITPDESPAFDNTATSLTPQMTVSHRLLIRDHSNVDPLITSEEKNVCLRKLSAATNSRIESSVHCRPYTFAGLAHEWKEMELMQLDRLYGDLKVANSAASSIQICYRNYRLRKRFSQLCESNRNSIVTGKADPTQSSTKPHRTLLQLPSTKPTLTSLQKQRISHYRMTDGELPHQVSALLDDHRLSPFNNSLNHQLHSPSTVKKLDELDHILQHISSNLCTTSEQAQQLSSDKPSLQHTEDSVTDDSGILGSWTSSHSAAGTSHTECDTHSDLSSLHDSCSSSSFTPLPPTLLHSMGSDLLESTSATSANNGLMSQSICLLPSTNGMSMHSTNHAATLGGLSRMNSSRQDGLGPALSALELERAKGVGIAVFNKNPLKGLHYLLRRGIIPSHSPQRISQFLLRHHVLINKITMAEFLGTLRDDYITQISRQFIRSLDIRNQEIDVAFRELMKYVHASCEEAKIMKLLRDFSDVYVEENRIRVAAQFPHPECVYLLTFAILLLHMNLHHPVIRCQRHLKMTLNGFCEWVQDEACCGPQMDRNLLCSIYQRIRNHEMLSLKDNSTQVRWLDQHLIHKHTASQYANMLKSQNKVAMGSMKSNACSTSLLPRPLALEAHRRLIADFVLYEVKNPKSRQRDDAHPRVVFLLNDIILVTKAKEKRLLKGGDKERVFHYRRHFYIDAVEVVPFYSTKLPNGIHFTALASGTLLDRNKTLAHSSLHSSASSMLMRGATSHDVANFIQQVTTAREEFVAVEQCLQASSSSLALGGTLSKSLDEGLDQDELNASVPLLSSSPVAATTSLSIENATSTPLPNTKPLEYLSQF